MKAITAIRDFLRAYPFMLLFSVVFLVVFTSTYIYTNQDRAYYQLSEARLDNLAIDSFHFQSCVAADSAKSTARLLKSIMMLKERKNNAMADATWYYEGTFMFSHILGICSLLGTILLILVITKGWEGVSTDLKITFGAIFMTCSTCYFLPRLMNNDKNYIKNINTYYNFSKQINYSSKILSYHCCCDNSRNSDSILTAAADSNFNVINNNITMYYDIDANEATKYFDEFKSNKAFKK